MRFRDSYRVPILLLSCCVAALAFPRACAETRVGFGALLPATAELTGAESRDADAAHREKEARLAAEIARLTAELDARPSGPIGDARIARSSARRLIGVAARVRQRDASSAGRSFVVDVGQADGVKIGAPVTAGDSLVGRVVAASAHAARVVRIDDPTTASTVPATMLRSAPDATKPAASGVARGTGDGDVRVFLLRAGDAAVGDLAVTGVGDPLVPEGLLLGEVVRFADDDRDGSYEAFVRPTRDLDTLSSVYVLREDAGDAPARESAGK